MTMDELNALYNNMSVYGDTYTSPTTTIPTDPNAGKPPILEPLIPGLPIVQQLGRPDDNNDGGIKTLGNNRIDSNDPTFRDPFNDILENYMSTEDLEKYSDNMFNVQETKSKGVGIEGLFKLLEKISPTANIMKLGNNVLTNTQKYFADKKETKRLFEIQEAEKARQLKIAQEQIRVAEEQKAMQRVIEQQAMDEAAYRNQPGQYGGDNRQQEREQAGPGYSGSGTAAEMGSFKKGGRTGYGKGGIVTL